MIRAGNLDYSCLGHKFSFKYEGELHKRVELKRINLVLGVKLELTWDTGDGYPWRTTHSPDAEFISES